MAVKIEAFRLSGRVEIDAKAAHKDLKLAESEAKSLTKSVEQSSVSFKGLKQASESQAKSTRQTLAQSLLEGKRNIGGLVREARAAQKDFEKLEKAEAKALKLTSSGGGFKGLLGGLSGGSGDSGGGLLGGLASGLQLLPGLSVVAGALGSVTSVMQSGLKIGFDFNRTMEEGHIAFEVLLKDGGKAKQLLSELDKMAPLSPFDFTKLVEETPKLLAFKFSMEEVTRVLTAAGDAAGKDVGKFEGIITALGQIKTKGKLQGDELIQLAENGIPALDYLGNEIAKVDKGFAKLKGEKRDAALQKLLVQGRISSTGAVEAIMRGIEGQFGGIGARFANETASGRESQLRDNLGRTLGAGSGNLFDAYKDTLEKINTLASAPQTMEAALKVNQAMGAGITSVEGFTSSLLNYRSAIDEASNDLTQRAQRFQEGSLTDKAKIIGGVYMDYTPGGMLLRGGKNLMQGKNFLAPAGKFSPQDQFLQSPKSDTRRLIEENARRTAITPEILEAMLHQESRGKSNAVSNKGARGLMQLMPATAARFGVTNSFDPAQNIAGGATYMRWLLNRFKGNTQLALAGYNTGEGNVDKAIKRAGGSHRFEDIKPYLAKETQGYVTSIMADIRERLANSGRGGSGGVAINDDYEVETGFTYSGGPARRKLRYGSTPVQSMSTISQEDYERNSRRDPFVRPASPVDVRIVNSEKFFDTYDRDTGFISMNGLPQPIASKLSDLAPDLPESMTTLVGEFKSMAGEFGTFGLGFPPLIAGMQSLDIAVTKTDASLLNTQAPIKGLIKAADQAAYELPLTFGQKLRGSLDQASVFLPSQQVGKKRGFLSKFLGGAAPFLNFIPGFGPIAAQLASVASSAIGGDYGGALSGAAGLDFKRKAAKFGGKRAHGGEALKGRAYIVGDGGREEAFIPDEDGWIHPDANSLRRGASSGSASSGGNNQQGYMFVAALQRLERHLERIESTTPGDVFVAGAKARPHAATDAVNTSLAMDASRIDLMGRRLNLA